MFPKALNQCFDKKKRLFCENQPIFVVRLPIHFSILKILDGHFFDKIIGQKQLLPLPKNSSFFFALALLLTQKNKNNFSSQTTFLNRKSCVLLSSFSVVKTLKSNRFVVSLLSTIKFKFHLHVVAKSYS